MDNLIYDISTLVIPVLLAITLHEAAHGWVALQFGDDTALRQGRVTLNPIRHIDAFGTILLPAMLLFASGGRFMFGFAKPVPVNFMRLRNPRRDSAIVAAAGPASNILMAAIAAMGVHLASYFAGPVAGWLQQSFSAGVLVNLLLALFNMLPMPPLDGGRVAVGLLPTPLARPLARLERAGFVIILVLALVLPYLGRQIGYDLNILGWLIVRPAFWLTEHFILWAGVLWP